MKKTLYSLMLNEEVVRQVDALAHRLGTNRSNLINQILAEYVDYVTPERRINDILSAVEQLLSPSRELVPFFAPLPPQVLHFTFFVISICLLQPKSASVKSMVTVF